MNSNILFLLIAGTVSLSFGNYSTIFAQSNIESNKTDNNVKFILNTISIDEKNGTIIKLENTSQTISEIDELYKALNNTSNFIQKNQPAILINEATGEVSVYRDIDLSNKGLVDDMRESLVTWSFMAYKFCKAKVVDSNGIRVTYHGCDFK